MVEGVSCRDCAENCSFGGGWEATAPIAGISPEVAMERRVGGLGAGDGCFGLNKVRDRSPYMIHLQQAPPITLHYIGPLNPEV